MKPPPLTGPAATAYAEAMRAHREGRLVEAESGYRRALQLAPEHADVLHMLAVLNGQLGRPEQAEEHFKAALARSGQELHWRNYAKFLPGSLRSAWR